MLADIGLADSQQFPGADSAPRSITGLIRHGADVEDEGSRPKNHFFDPHYDRPATLPPWLTIGIPVGEMSPDWIVDGTDQKPGEHFSVKRARELYIEGLAGVTPYARNAAWGWMFQTLGHVIHHLQDMAQPQHVRNDVHYINEYLATHFDGEFKLLWEDRSWYERYSLENPTAWGAHAPASATPVSFSRARDFWATIDDRGIAQYTNRNFVSSDTNFTLGSQGQIGPADDYPFPQPLGRKTRSLLEPSLGIANAAELCAKLVTHPVAHDQPCEMDFVEVAVVDGYSGGAPVPNDRAASFSVFDAELRDVDHTAFGLQLFTLNSINFKAAYRFLIPKAINYSAGMLNHFFRGRLRIKNAEVQDGYVTLDLQNVSAPGNDFSDGKFTVHYDSISGARKPLLPEFVDLPVGAIHQLRFAVPGDIDLRAEHPFGLVYSGRIGGDAGVSGLAFDVPDLLQGFVIGVTLPNGPAAPQLLHRFNEQWAVHPQGQMPVAGTVDWKGWYVNGKPTRILAWDGWRYGRLGTVVAQRSPNIYAGGKPMAVAPWPVLGAALQKDAEGNASIIAICEDTVLDQDVVIRRPARKSKSAALYDAATAPDGWRVIARWPRPAHLSSTRESWQFNGAGTEAQTLRALFGNFGQEVRPYTRLKVSLSGDAAVFQDLGNTKVQQKRVRKVTASRTVDGQTYDYCSGSGTADATITLTETGGSVVAVDYIDNQEVLARINVDTTEVWTEQASLGSSTRTDAEEVRVSRWTLQIGPDQHEVLAEDSTQTIRYRTSEPYLYAKIDALSERSPIVALDLRSGLVVLRRSHEERVVETTHPTDLRGGSTQTVANHHRYLVGGVAHAVSPPVDISASSASSERDWLTQTVMRQCSGGSGYVPTEIDVAEGAYDVNIFANRAAYSASNDIIRAASDRSGNVFVSLRHTDPVTKQFTYLSHLTGTDLMALLGVDPQRTLFAPIQAR